MSLNNIISSHITTLYRYIWFFPTLSAPPKSEHGEYCFGVFTLAKPLGKSPNIIAEEIAGRLRWDRDNFTQVNVIGGYVNFSCTARIWIDILAVVKDQKKSPDNGKTIVVDYIGANAGKPLHIGHLCTPSVGQTICNIYNHLGYRVIGDSHFGDWGGIFGKLITQAKLIDYLSIQDPTIDRKIIEFTQEEEEIYSKISSGIGDWNSRLEWVEKEKIEKISDLLSQELQKKWDQDIVNILYYSYILINSYAEHNEIVELQCRTEFKKLSSWDKVNINLWQNFTNASIIEIEEKLDILNVHTTYNIGESFYEGLNLPRPNNEDYPDLQWNMKDIVAELIKNWVATQNEDGSVWVVFPEESKLPSCILQKKDGTGLYLTSDLAAIKYRLNNGWNPSKIIYSVDVRQQLHLRQAFAIAKMAWPEKLENVELFHAFNGFIKLKEGAMSTRHGTVIFLEKLIEEGEERTEKVLKEKWRSGENSLKKEDIQAITVGAIKYSYLSQDREKDVTFDWDKALSFEGNSGPYIQYACVRARKILQDEKAYHIDENNNKDFNLSQYDTALLRTLAEMEQKIQTTAETYKPHTLALYAYDLAVCFNSFYVHTPKILEEADENLKGLRLTLCKLTSEKLTLVFELLWMKIPSEM